MKRSQALAAVITSLIVVLSAGVSPGAGGTPPKWSLVALGDSDTTGAGDASGKGWVGRYATLLRQRTGAKVSVHNTAVDGTTSGTLLAQIRSDMGLRDAVKGAQIVLLGIGGADLNAGDSRHEAGKCKGTACYAGDLRRFGTNFAAIVATVRSLRGSQPTVVRAITLPNAVPGAQDVVPPYVTVNIGAYQARTLRTKICAAVKAQHGECVDVLRAFNGPSGTENAYEKGLMNHAECCYASAKGQQLIADLLFKTGLRPLR